MNILIKYFNGVRMLEDMSTDKITIFEQVLYLIFIFSSFMDVVDKVLESYDKTNIIMSYEWLGQASGVIGILVITFLLNKHKNVRIIESYICLYIAASITSYLLLIPLLFFLEFLFEIIFNIKLNDSVSDFLITIYPAFFIITVTYLWTKKNVASNLSCKKVC